MLLLEKFLVFSFVLSFGFLIFVIYMHECVTICSLLCAYLYIYVLMYYIRFLVTYFVFVQSTWTLWVTSCTGFLVVIGFLTFPFIISIRVQYFPRYHNFRGEMIEIYDVVMSHCKYVCKSHEYYINVVDYVTTIGICDLFSIGDVLVHHCQHTFLAALTIAVYKPILWTRRA